MDLSLLRPLSNRSIVAVAGSYGLLLAISQMAGLFGLWLGCLVALSCWRYAYAVLRYTAQGRRSFPPPDIESMNPANELALVGHFLAFPALAAWFSLFAFAGQTGVLGALSQLLPVLLILIFPASAAIMALNGRLVNAFRPARISRVIATMGSSYALLLTACCGLFLFRRLLADVLLPGLGPLAVVMGSALQVWLLLALFAMIGAAIREHRRHFEIPGEEESTEDRRARQLAEDQLRDWQRELDNAYGALRTGHLDQGYGILRGLIEQQADPLPVLRWLFEATAGWEDSRHALQVAKRLIPALLAVDQQPEALAVFRRCTKLSEEFELDSDSAQAVAAYARSIGQDSLADDAARSG